MPRFPQHGGCFCGDVDDTSWVSLIGHIWTRAA